jgi:hypothetical protein
MIRQRIATALRQLATHIDGQEFISASWHKVNVKGMTKFAGWVEGYIIELEDYIRRQHTCVKCQASLLPSEAAPHCLDCTPTDEQREEWYARFSDDPIEDMRKKHGRFDTKKLRDAGAWS